MKKIMSILVMVLVMVLAIVAFSFCAYGQTYPKAAPTPVNEAMATAASQVILNASQSGQYFSNAGSGSYAVQYILPPMPFTINGAVTSAAPFVTGEALSQATSGATAVFSGLVTGGMVITTVGGGAIDNTHTWTGGTSGATFVPTSIALINSSLAGIEFNFIVTDVSSTMTIKPGAGIPFIIASDYKDYGSCTTSVGGACAAQSFTVTYAVAPKCIATWNGTGALTGILSAPSGTTTVTPASSVGGDTTAVVNWVCHGNMAAVTTGHSIKAPATAGSWSKVICKLNTAGTAYVWVVAGNIGWIDNGS